MNSIEKEMQKYATELRKDGEGKLVVEANVRSLIESKWTRLVELGKDTGKEPGEVRDEIVRKVMDTLI